MLFHVLIFLKSRCALQWMRWGLWSLGKSGDCSFRRISASRAFRLWPLPIPQSLDARGPHSFLFRSQIISSGSSHVPGCGKFQFTSFFLSSVPGHWPRVHPGEAPQDLGPPPGHRLTPRPVTPPRAGPSRDRRGPAALVSWEVLLRGLLGAQMLVALFSLHCGPNGASSQGPSASCPYPGITWAWPVTAIAFSCAWLWMLSSKLHSCVGAGSYYQL